MLFDHVSPQEMQAARVVTGATMAAFLMASVLGGRARQARIAVAVVYGAAVIATIVYYLL